MPKEIKALVTHYLSNTQSWKFALLDQWPTILGPLSERVTLERIHDEALVLAVDDSCWLQELYHLTPVLLKTINQILDQPRIKHLRFKLAGTKEKKAPVQHKQAEASKIVTLSHQEKKSLNTICDETLREALKNYLIRCHREKE
jgi:hypothetical protein